MDKTSTVPMRWNVHLIAWGIYYIVNASLNVMGEANVNWGTTIVFGCYMGTFYLINWIAHRFFTYQDVFATLLQLALAVALIYAAVYVIIYLFLPHFGVYLFYPDKPFHLGKYIRNMTHHLEPALLAAGGYQLMLLTKTQQQRLLEKERELSASLKRELEAERRKAKVELDNHQLRYMALTSQLKSHWSHSIWGIIRNSLTTDTRSAEIFTLMMELQSYYYRHIGPETSLVGLNEEVQIIHLLAKLNTLANPDQTGVDIQVSDPLLARQIPAFMLSTPLENAFKFGDMKDRSRPIAITLRSDASGILFTCSNKVDPVKVRDARRSGLGLNCLRQQLDYFAPGRNSITIENDDSFFSITISITY